jgi:diguanylate cyclase (GGDEF)-like protein
MLVVTAIAVLAAIAAAAVAAERTVAVRRLRDASLTDPLTACENRRGWERELALALARAQRAGIPVSVALLDLNDFKVVNDTQGHAAGDATLREAADAWRSQLRVTDVLARLGGDEFAVLLPDCAIADAHRVAARLRAATPHPGGCAVGVAEWDGSEDASALLGRGDRELYADKARARRGVLGDPARLAGVRSAGLLAAERRERLKTITDLAAQLLHTPMAAVTLIDDARQHIVAHEGLGGAGEAPASTPLSHSFCQHAVATGRPLVVPDAREHPLVHDNPAVEELGVHAYAGMPLTLDGRPLGALCAFDREPHAWSAEDLATLRVLARQVEATFAGDPAAAPPA